MSRRRVCAGPDTSCGALASVLGSLMLHETGGVVRTSRRGAALDRYGSHAEKKFYWSDPGCELGRGNRCNEDFPPNC